MTRAEHSSELLWKNSATGKDETHFGGEPGLFGDMRWIGEYYKPDLILIPIGGHFVMNPQDAAVATRDMLKPKHAIPIHYGTFPSCAEHPRNTSRCSGRPRRKSTPSVRATS